MIEGLAERILKRAEGQKRVLIGVAGPPGSGKSTLAEKLAGRLGEIAAIVPMDGFHLDNDILDQRGHRAIKGAPETFDATGFLAMLVRLASIEKETFVPLFDRAADCSHAGARLVTPAHRVVIVEGNYLLLRRPVWDKIPSLLQLSIFLKPDRNTLDTRLVQRWRDHGFEEYEAIERARGNDLTNINHVLENSGPADISIEPNEMTLN